MRVTIFGHAALYIETSDQRILLDPFFSDNLVEGALVFNPSRRFDLGKLPTPTMLVVTHGHFDHFHPASLESVSRDLPVITANDPPLIAALTEAGFSQIIVCHPWDAIQIGDTELIATPSDHEEEEVGLLIRNQGCSFWHMADSEVSVATGDRLVQHFGNIDLISAKHQPSVRPMIGYLRNMGATFDKVEVLTWLETACRCNPGLVFPYASGICFSDRHAWFNRYAFPLTPEEVVSLLQQRLGSSERATTVLPGDVIELRQGELPQKHLQASPFVQMESSFPMQWEPIDTRTLCGLTNPNERPKLQQALEAFLSGPLALWLQRKIEQGNNALSIFQSEQIIWQLIVHTRENERLTYFIDFRSQNFVAALGEHPEANFFTHISGQTLYEVLQEDVEGLVFWLTGSVRSYEKVMGVKDGRFYYLQLPKLPQDHLCDPLTYYLRHFGTGALSPNEPEIADVELDLSEYSLAQHSQNSTEPLSDLEVLMRQGGNHRVLSKKALLTYLVLQEAERIGLEVSIEEVQAASDAFRQRFGLVNQPETDRWLASSGFTLSTYSAMMRNLATVMKLEQQYASQIEPLVLDHQRIAAAQAAALQGAL